MGRSEAGGVQGGRGNFYPTFQLQSMQQAGQQALWKSPALIVNHPASTLIYYIKDSSTHTALLLLLREGGVVPATTSLRL
jgi:hypothetical protein